MSMSTIDARTIAIKTWYLCHRYGIMKTINQHIHTYAFIGTQSQSQTHTQNLKRGSIRIMQQLESVSFTNISSNYVNSQQNRKREKIQRTRCNYVVQPKTFLFESFLRYFPFDILFVHALSHLFLPLENAIE